MMNFQELRSELGEIKINIITRACIRFFSNRSFAGMLIQTESK
jgi:hypothetical protein